MTDYDSEDMHHAAERADLYEGEIEKLREERDRAQAESAVLYDAILHALASKPRPRGIGDDVVERVRAVVVERDALRAACDAHLRAFEEAKAFVTSFLRYTMSEEELAETPILNFVVGLAEEVRRTRVERDDALRAVREANTRFGEKL